MRDLQEYIITCMEELDKLHIEYRNVIDISENSRAMRRWGQCRAVPGGFAININSRLLDEHVPEKHLKETIMHELLHTCDGCFNHGGKWQLLASLVGRAYGYKIERAASCADMEVMENYKKSAKYEICCEKCGYTIYRYRKSNLVQNPDDYTCGVCGGKFNVKEISHVC